MEFVPPIDLTAGIDHVGEDHGWAQKYAILQRNSAVHGDIILDFDLVSNLSVRADEHVLTDNAVLSNARARHNMAEMPDLGSRANFSTLVDIAGFVYEVVAHLSPVQVGMAAVINLRKCFAANAVGQLDGRVRLLDTKTSPRERLLVNAFVQVIKTT